MVPLKTTAFICGTPWGDHFTAQLLCGGVADVNGGEHIHRCTFQLGKAQNTGGLTIPADVAHKAADGVGAFAVFQQDAHRLCQIVRPALGGGIVQRNAEISHGGAGQPLLNDLPRGQPVGKGNNAEIVRQRCTQHRPAAEGSGQSGHDVHGNVRVARGKLQQGLAMPYTPASPEQTSATRLPVRAFSSAQRQRSSSCVMPVE